MKDNESPEGLIRTAETAQSQEYTIIIKNPGCKGIQGQEHDWQEKFRKCGIQQLECSKCHLKQLAIL